MAVHTTFRDGQRRLPGSAEQALVIGKERVAGTTG